MERNYTMNTKIRRRSAGKRTFAALLSFRRRLRSRCLLALLVAALSARAANGREFHVSVNGDDANDGTASKPLKTISAAAEAAQAGDGITVHEGIYRERVTPPRGGESDTKRIVYQAAPGEKVEIRGSEVVKTWEKVQDDVWKATLPNTFFGGYNPYSDLIRGDWFNGRGRKHHTGAVYLYGEWLDEAAGLEDVLKPAGDPPLWFGEVGEADTTIWAQFKGVNPNEQLVEINVRRAVFYPEKPGVNYITVRGFILRQAATQWAPPTAEQIGLVGTHWSKGWIIEDNIISHSRCVGVALGKYGDQWDNTSSNTAKGYVRTIERALESGWSKGKIGHHVVRNNRISHCEQAGIVGSLGAVFSRIIGNTIHDIHVRRLFTGWEMAGVKIHAAIDVEIARNRVYRAYRGLWMDWMAQGMRITGNLCYANDSEDLFVEVNHGPFLVDNNLFLSGVSVRDMSQGGAYAHNLITGKIVSRPDGRSTPYHPAHATALAGMSTIKGGDNRFYNNLLVGGGGPEFGLGVYDARELPLATGGNVYYHDARPYSKETNPLVLAEKDPRVRVVEEGDGVFVHFTVGPELGQAATRLVTTALLGKAAISGLPYENPDGSPLTVETDYFGAARDASRPTAGPFERPGQGDVKLKVW